MVPANVPLIYSAMLPNINGGSEMHPRPIGDPLNAVRAIRVETGLFNSKRKIVGACSSRNNNPPIPPLRSSAQSQ